jgi:membrane associated rhomboid family serine protease
VRTVLPLKDENPTRRPAVATMAIILACVGIYFFWQPTPFASTNADVDFSIRHAAIPCEVRHGRPLTIDELRATYIGGAQEACRAGSPDSPPGLPHKSVWLAVLTSMFLHGSLWHLGGNMLFLWIFGNNVEDRLGVIRYLAFYLVGGLVATLTFVAVNPNATIAMIGASGAIAAVMGAYLVWFPDAPVRTLLFVVLVRIRAKWLLTVWFVLQFFTAPNSGVAWAAHVGGFLFGAVVGIAVRASDGVQRALLRRDARPDGPWDPTGGAGYGYYNS